MKLARALALGLGLTGCDEILSLDDYEPEADADAAAPAPVPAPTIDLPLLPAQPDDVGGRRQECAECVENMCRDEREICYGSERCVEMLLCMGPSETSEGCSDPACLARCLTEHPHSPYFHAYFACVFGNGVFPTPTEPQCATKCGPNWSCLNSFDWDAPPAEPATVYAVSVVDSLSEPGVPYPGVPYPGFPLLEAAACGDGYATNEPLGALGCGGFSNVSPTVGVKLPLGGAIAFRSTSDYFGLRVPRRTYPWPAPRSGPVWVLMIDDDSETYIADRLGYEPTQGVLGVAQNDCLGAPAATDIDIPDAVPATEDFAPGTTVETHLTGLGESDPIERPNASSIFVNVVPNDAVVITSTLDDGATPVSQSSALVAGGWFTDVTLFPRTRREAGRR